MSERDELKALAHAVKDAITNFNRFGEVCAFEGHSMIYADSLLELEALADQALAAPIQPVATQEDAGKVQAVKYDKRCRPMWRDEGQGWSTWEECSEDTFHIIAKEQILHDWQWEARALYASQPSNV